MEPVAAFVSIVSLLRIYKQERGESSKADHQTFVEWAETLHYASYGPGRFSLQPQNGEPFNITEPRFLRNDLEQLAALGLFSLRHNPDGNPLFGPTRSGLRYLQAIDGKTTSPDG